MYLVNLLLFKFYFYIKSFLCFIFIPFLLHVFYTSLHQAIAGEVTGTQQRDRAAFFIVESVFY